jgi:biotin transport system substrate-specific component
MPSALQTQPRLLYPSASAWEPRTGKILLAIVATGFVAACAHISVPLPFTPVPITLQDFAVLLVGMTLGPAAGFSAMVLYLAEGALGLPVFTPYSAGGIAHLLGPNGRYLFSYPLAAAVAGVGVRIMGRITSRFRSALVAAAIASLPIFAIGAGWLAYFLYLNLSAAWTLAVAPFSSRGSRQSYCCRCHIQYPATVAALLT